jgi:hypothetical protein
MKVPSLFRIPKYQQYKIVPRYYDPIKEDIDQRTAQIKNELESRGDSNLSNRSSRLAGAFTKSRGQSKGGSATFMQLIIMMLLAFLVFGYIYLGNVALYIFLTLSSVLLFLKIKRKI